MNKQHEDRQVTDEFEPIELGSVSEETKGDGFEQPELLVGPNTRAID